MIKAIVITVVVIFLLLILASGAEGQESPVEGLTPTTLIETKFAYGPWGPYGIRGRLLRFPDTKTLWVTNSRGLWESVGFLDVCIAWVNEFNLVTWVDCRPPKYLPMIIKPWDGR